MENAVFFFPWLGAMTIVILKICPDTSGKILSRHIYKLVELSILLLSCFLLSERIS